MRSVKRIGERCPLKHYNLSRSCITKCEHVSCGATPKAPPSDDLRAAVNFLQAGGTPSEEPVDDTDPFAAVIHNNWLDLRDDLKTYLKSNGDRMSMMNHFHRKMSQYFDNDCDTVFSVLSVWGDMMERVYDWPGSTEAYIDVFVGRLKTKLEVENNE